MENKTLRELIIEGFPKKNPRIDSNVTDLITDFIGDEMEIGCLSVTKDKKPRNYRKTWKKEDILKLYQGLMEVGYNTELLSLYFNREWTPKQIHDKIKREEKIRPKLVAQAMLGKKK